MQHQPEDVSRSVSAEWSDEVKDAGNSDSSKQDERSPSATESDALPQENYQQFLNKILPAFDNTTATNVTTTAGKTVFLPCSVRHLADKTVRRKVK